MRRLRRLAQKRALRWSEGACVLEGPDLVAAGLAAGAEFEAIYVDAASVGLARVTEIADRARGAGVRVFALMPGVLAGVADAKTPQPVIATVRFSARGLASLDANGLVLVLHDLRDPGNVGTAIRSADAAGAAAVVLSGDSVDPYNPKTLRATAGSIFHIPVCVADFEDALTHFASRGSRLYAAVVEGGTAFRDVDLAHPSVVVIGNEATGLEAAAGRCDEKLSIPMVGRGESLNAGVAASLIVFEALRQRQDAKARASRPSLEGL